MRAVCWQGSHYQETALPICRKWRIKLSRRLRGSTDIGATVPNL
ncbi:hypothetical protein [Brasilonema bromeliae]